MTLCPCSTKKKEVFLPLVFRPELKEQGPQNEITGVEQREVDVPALRSAPSVTGAMIPQHTLNLS